MHRSRVVAELEIWLHGDERHTVVRLCGRFDDAAASFAGRVVHDLVVDPHGAVDIEMHLDEVSDYDEASARVLLRMSDEAIRANRRIVMFGLPACLRAVLGPRVGAGETAI
jgi:anti-anti-sigma regulatory factor